MRVSVVIPLYNKVAYIQRAIDSVLRQSLTDFEVVVIDDGSSDGGGEIVRRCGDPRVRLIVQKNAGEGYTRQRGMEEARGEFIAFLDADDEWAPRFLERAVRLMEDFPTAGAGGLGFEHFEEAQRKGEAEGHPPADPPFRGIVKDYFAAALPRSILWSSSTILRRSVFQELKPNPTKALLGPDHHLWCQIALRYPIAYDGAVSSYYHTEAAGRINPTIYMKHEDLPFVPILKEALKRKETGGAAEVSIRRFMAKHQLLAVRRHLVGGGSRKDARWLLRRIRPVSGFRSKWIRYWIKALLPRPGRARQGGRDSPP